MENVSLKEIEDLANQLALKEKEEELALCSLLKKTGEIIFPIPPSKQWKYDYEKVEYKDTKWGRNKSCTPGVATARFCLVKNAWGVGNGLDIHFGATESYIPQPIKFTKIREKMGGLAGILTAIKISLVKNHEDMEVGRDEAMKDIKSMS